MSAPVDPAGVHELIRRAREGTGEAAVLAGEAAVRAADLLRDEALGYDARMALIRAGIFQGWADRAIVALAWCRAHPKRDPDEISTLELVWSSKWVIGAVADFPEISRERIEASLADFAAMSEGWGPRAATELGLQLQISMGELPRLRESLEAWMDTERSLMSDCEACARNLEIKTWIVLGESEKAISRAAPILEGELRCAEVPHVTIARLLGPLLDVGEKERAAQLHRRGYRLVAKNREFLPSAGEHIQYLVRTGDLARGVALFERHAPWTLENRNGARVLALWTAGVALFAAVARERSRSLTLKLPEGVPGWRADGAYHPAELRDAFEKCARELAGRFDARNGNAYHVGLVDQALALAKPERKVAKRRRQAAARRPRGTRPRP